MSVPGAAPTLESVSLTGVSVTVDGTNSIAVSASAASVKGSDITNDVAWSVAPAGKGVTVAANGAITVDAKAEAGNYTVTATPNGTSVLGTAKSATLMVTRAPSVATAVKIYKNGTAVGNTDTIIIPVAGAAVNTYTYTAKLFDQFDAEMPGAVQWTWSGTADGVTHNNGVVTVAAGATKDAEYTLTAQIGGKSATVTLTAKDIDITKPTATLKPNPTYGDTWDQIVTLSGGSASLNGAAVPGAFAVKESGRPAVGEQTYTVVFNSTDGKYKDVTVETGTVTVAKKPLTITNGTLAVDKEYDGTTVAGAIEGQLGLSGVLEGETVSVAMTGVQAGAYPKANIGTYTITLSNIGLTGADADNYTVPGTYDFNAARITKTLPKAEHFDVTVPAEAPYNNTARTAAITVKSGVSGMGNITVKYAKVNEDGSLAAASTAAPVNAGTYRVIASITEGQNFASKELDTTQNIVIAKAERNLTLDGDVSNLTALPGKPVTLPLKYDDLDKSAKVGYVLDSGATFVSRKDNVFTAVGNGQTGMTISIPATDNYNAATEVTATVTAIAQPVLGVSSVTGEEGDVLTAVLSGTAINVTGVASSATVAPYVTLILAEGFGLVQEQSGNTLTVKKGSETISTFTITTKVTVKPAGMDISEKTPNLTGSANLTDAKTEGTAASTAESLFVDAKQLANEAEKEGKLDGLGEGYIVKVSVQMEITETGYTQGQSLKMEITPKYTVIAHQNGDETNYYDVAPDPIEIPQRAIKSPITIKVKLPADGFNPKYAKHTLSSGSIEYLKLAFETISGSRYAVWQQSSFSEVELIAPDKKVTITYTKSDGTTVTQEHDIGELALLTDTGSGTFNGWTLYAPDGTTVVGNRLKALTEEMLSTYNGQTLTAKSDGFYRPSSGGGSSGGSYVPAGTYPVNVKRPSNGTVSASPTHAKKGDTVTLTVKPNTGYELDSITVTDKDGNTVRVREKETNVYTFTMPDSAVSVEAIFKAAETKPVNPFRDVSSGAYYYDAVLWAVENGVTGGTTATTFSPGNACTRAQTVTFLWRAAGSPAPASRNNPFTDVAPGAYYYDAVLWAVEKGITTGVTATTFGPNATVNRGQVVTFLSRSAKAAPVNGANPFTDVPANAYYANAVLWAVENGITNGTTATQFSPAAPCTRGQIVTFLYRYFV